MSVLDVPYPTVGEKTVLVRTAFSVISTGTERRTVSDARKGYVGKAMARQKEVRQVLHSVRDNGLLPTYRMVMDRLDAPSPLGYSCAGTVIAVGRDVTEFRAGDRVACGGEGASHAEVVAVPEKLCAPVPDGVDLRHAAFTTLGAIALQGVRQADVGLGGNCVVIGLGLVGILTIQLLEAAGVRTFGIDLDPAAVDLARKAGASETRLRGDAGLEDAIAAWSDGAGTDAVIITAGTSSTDPVDLAGRLCRSKGRVVVVGVVPTGFERKAYYRKELDLRMSCSYGPGRYDADYEEKGLDYPIGYVRWTENRNMQAFLQLLGRGRLDVEPLISHSFPLEQAPDAYAMIVDGTEHHAAILLEYDSERPAEEVIRLADPPGIDGDARPAVGFVGAGSFAQNVLLRAVKDKGSLVGVATARPNRARHVADRFGFAYCTGEASDVIADERINTVFVVTRHNLHARYVVEALRQGKHVFVEKPLCLVPDELDDIIEAYQGGRSHLMVGFNRRFSPLVKRLRESLPAGRPRAITYRINASGLPPDHWGHDPAVGGGRIIGEVCHFLDLIHHLVEGRVCRIAASALDDAHGLNDTVSITLGFTDGSTASLAYFSNGSKALEKERLEVFCAGQVAVLDDFKTLTLHGPRSAKHRLRRQDKGHTAEIEAFLAAVRGEAPAPIPFDELVRSTRLTFAVLDALREDPPVPFVSTPPELIHA